MFWINVYKNGSAAIYKLPNSILVYHVDSAKQLSQFSSREYYTGKGLHRKRWPPHTHSHSSNKMWIARVHIPPDRILPPLLNGCKIVLLASTDHYNKRWIIKILNSLYLERRHKCCVDRIKNLIIILLQRLQRRRIHIDNSKIVFS